ncbi:endonuclease V [Pedobacter boryungensis]|uniref:Endonuclease V n=1 Tax=Pedobacter boryungensis TaxID=869962 RepID=A0ABX2D9Y5_9SPHI|nr:endonuclease V [Pedobacter boryungensis]NQX30837.1 endonuclease V [Pedobacter boryungensis]
MDLNYDELTFVEAKLMQEEFRKQLKFDIPNSKVINSIAATDISYNPNSTTMYGTIVILSYPELRLKAYSLVTCETNFPYKAGYLGFREVPTLIKAWEQIENKPDVVVLDGQGYLHPRRMGIASHFGLLTAQATIGCAKSSLYGFYEEPSIIKYSFSKVFEHHTNEHIGYALRTKNKTKPVYISPGYGLSLVKSLEIMKKCIGNHRIPEPTRLAHEIVNDFRMGKLQAGYKEVNPTPVLF